MPLLRRPPDSQAPSQLVTESAGLTFGAKYVSANETMTTLREWGSLVPAEHDYSFPLRL